MHTPDSQFLRRALLGAYAAGVAAVSRGAVVGHQADGAPDVPAGAHRAGAGGGAVAGHGGGDRVGAGREAEFIVTRIALGIVSRLRAGDQHALVVVDLDLEVAEEVAPLLATED